MSFLVPELSIATVFDQYSVKDVSAHVMSSVHLKNPLPNSLIEMSAGNLFFFFLFLSFFVSGFPPLTFDFSSCTDAFHPGKRSIKFQCC